MHAWRSAVQEKSNAWKTANQLGIMSGWEAGPIVDLNPLSSDREEDWGGVPNADRRMAIEIRRLLLNKIAFQFRQAVLEAVRVRLRRRRSGETVILR